MKLYRLLAQVIASAIAAIAINALTTSAPGARGESSHIQLAVHSAASACRQRRTLTATPRISSSAEIITNASQGRNHPTMPPGNGGGYQNAAGRKPAQIA